MMNTVSVMYILVYDDCQCLITSNDAGVGTSEDHVVFENNSLSASLAVS